MKHRDMWHGYVKAIRRWDPDTYELTLMPPVGSPQVGFGRGLARTNDFTVQVPDSEVIRSGLQVGWVVTLTGPYREVQEDPRVADTVFEAHKARV